MTSESDFKILWHIAAEADWNNRNATHYKPEAFANEGFIHLCETHQLAGVYERYYSSVNTPLFLLHINSDLSNSDKLFYEDTANRGEAFPHLYSELSISDIDEAISIPESSEQAKAFLGKLTHMFQNLPVAKRHRTP